VVKPVEALSGREAQPALTYLGGSLPLFILVHELNFAINFTLVAENMV
jgi:hypothetical protein